MHVRRFPLSGAVRLKGFALRRPLVFSLLLAFSLLALMFLSRLPFPQTVVGDVGELSPEQIRQPTAR